MILQRCTLNEQVVNQRTDPFIKLRHLPLSRPDIWFFRVSLSYPAATFFSSAARNLLWRTSLTLFIFEISRCSCVSSSSLAYRKQQGGKMRATTERNLSVLGTYLFCEIQCPSKQRFKCCGSPRRWWITNWTI